MILRLVSDAMDAGASERACCRVIGLAARTLQRWRAQGIGDDNRAGPVTTPANKLSQQEREAVLSALNSEEHRDLSPRQIVPRLADEGMFLASESTMYRVLHEEGQQKHRERSREPQARHRPNEHVANGPSQVWSWDITYLRSPVRGAFYYVYLVLDVYSRKIVGAAVHDRECGELATALIDSTCRQERVSRGELVIHSDNGSPMKSATLLATLQVLGVVTSFSRPSVSNDNPFSESAFRTMKYRPEYPTGPFASKEAAAEWLNWFVRWYNTEHRHSGIRFVTPEQRHRRLDVEILERRRQVYEQARQAKPDRWAGKTRNWSPVDVVTLNPEPCPGERVA